MADPGEVRVGDAERQRVVDMLRRHTGEGRLTLDEFSERTGQVYAAVTRADLDAVLADLPADLGPPLQPPSDEHATTLTLGGRRVPRKRRFLAVMSGTEARGTWVAPRKIYAFAWWGHVDIDLSHALIETPVVDITAAAYMGSVTVKVPEGIPVDIRGFVLMGGTANQLRDAPVIPGAPLVRIRVRGLWGGVSIRHPRKRRRDRTGRSGSPVDVQGLVNDAMADAQDRVAGAIDLARGSMGLALGRGSRDDRIPDMPSRRAREHRHAHPHSRPKPGKSSRSNPSPPPTPSAPPAPAAPPAPTTPATPAAPPAPAAPAPAPAPAASEAGPAAAPSSNGSSPGRIPSGTLTILVSDIDGSTQLSERLGDQSWLGVLQAHNAIVRSHVEEHGGTEVKAVGDGFLVVFPSARGAVLAAMAIQRGMERYRKDNPAVPITVRLGLHTGEVVATEDDIFGQNVVVATRIADVAGAGEIVVSGLTRDLTASASDLGFDDGTDVELKGLSQPCRVHRVKV
jgi:class 3 adenylate cyclase